MPRRTCGRNKLAAPAAAAVARYRPDALAADSGVGTSRDVERMFGSRVAVRSDDTVDTDGVTLGCVDQIKCIRAGWESIQIVRDRAWHIPWAVPVALALCGPLARGVGVI